MPIWLPKHRPRQVLKQKTRQGARIYLWHLPLIGLFLVLLWAGIGFNLWHDHTAAEWQAANDTANLARSFDETITRTVESVDQTLLFVREAYQHDPAGLTTGAWVPGHVLMDALQVQIGLTDRDGTMIWSNLVFSPGAVSIADREHFLVQKHSVTDSLFISRPVIGRLSGKRSIQFTRKRFAADGSFAGVVVVSLDPAYLSQFYNSISIGNGAIILATTDGVILIRSPEREALSGSILPPEIKRRILRGTTDGPYRTVSSLDQVDRIFSSRQLGKYPLMLSVGLAANDVFAAYDRNKRLYLAVGVLLSAAGIVAGLALRRQRQSILDSRQVLAATLDNMAQGIIMIGADGTMPVINQRAVDLLGMPAEFLLDKLTFADIVEWQFANDEFGDSVTWAPELAQALRNKTRPHGTYIYERTRPSGLVLEVRTEGLADGGTVRTFTDITERRRNEVALAEARSRAVHAERMQALGQLAGGIAHDFNNILQAVQGGASLINKRADDRGSVQRFARMILDATERGTSITRRLLSFARRGELRAEPIEPGELLSGLRDVLSHTLGAGIVVDLRLPEGLPPILADKGQLETVLVNLATNARDAMPGGGSLTLSAGIDWVRNGAVHAADLPAGRYVHMAIADTGSGIEEPLLARVLEPFFSTKPPGQGTGLGLSMAKGFAEQSGGGLSIDSDVRRGTTVNVWLPAVVQAPLPSILATRSAVWPQDRGRFILLVDDEPMVRSTLAETLQDFGYTVMVAADGAEALRLLGFADVRVDVLVTDLSMPGIDGLAVIRQAQLDRPGLPAVLLTGYAGHGAQLAVSGSVSGTFSLVRKPVSASHLVDRIEALLAVTFAD